MNINTNKPNVGSHGVSIPAFHMGYIKLSGCKHGDTIYKYHGTAKDENPESVITTVAYLNDRGLIKIENPYSLVEKLGNMPSSNNPVETKMLKNLFLKRFNPKEEFVAPVIVPA